MSRTEECRKRIEVVKEAFDMLDVEPEAVMCDLLTDIALSLAQIADKIGCDYEERKEFVADSGTQASLVTVYHRRENK